MQLERSISDDDYLSISLVVKENGMKIVLKYFVAVCLKNSYFFENPWKHQKWSCFKEKGKIFS